MVAINFTVFVDKVENGTKNQTIRSRAAVRVGDKLQLYTGLRTKQCRKLKDVFCKACIPIILMERAAIPHGGVILTGIYLEEFAQHDGFDSYADMWKFFGKRANEVGEYHGKIIKW